MTLSQFLEYPLTHRMISYDELMSLVAKAIALQPEPMLLPAPAKKRGRPRKAV